MLDDFSSRLKMYEAKAPVDNIDNFINVNLDQIREADSEYCFEISTALFQYAYYLQRCINRERAFIGTIKSQENIVLAREWGQFSDPDDYKPKEIITQQIVQSNDYLRALNKLQCRCQAFIDETFGLVQLVQKSADNWLQMGRAKSYGSR